MLGIEELLCGGDRSNPEYQTSVGLRIIGDGIELRKGGEEVREQVLIFNCLVFKASLIVGSSNLNSSSSQDRLSKLLLDTFLPRYHD